VISLVELACAIDGRNGHVASLAILALDNGNLWDQSDS
jgi:hypothetical protein